MLFRLLATLVKIAIASLIVGTILAHFGITAEQLLKLVGLTPERVGELARQALAWALPNLLLGALIILPIWCVMALFRPPWRSLEDRYYDRYDRDYWR
jgi:putative exporter of polyketide antibiotics